MASRSGAITAILKTKEFEAALRKLGLAEPLVIFGAGVMQPDDRFPHLPRSIKSMTIDEALDLIAKTFHGVVFYGACGARVKV